jgi:hypothetical protein
MPLRVASYALANFGKLRSILGYRHPETANPESLEVSPPDFSNSGQLVNPKAPRCPDW